MKKSLFLWPAVLLIPSFAHAQNAEGIVPFQPSAVLKNAAVLREVRRGSGNPNLEVRAIYPDFKSRTRLSRYASGHFRSNARNQVGAFTRQAQKDLRALKSSRTVYAFDQTPNLHFYNPARLISVSFATYQYTGGAHGMYGTQTQNFGLVAGESRPRRLQLADFFRTGSNPRAALDQKLLAKLRANTRQEATWIRDGSVKTLGNLVGNFAVEKDGLRWFFPPYSVGPYSSGEFEVKLHRSELGPDFQTAWIDAR